LDFVTTSAEELEEEELLNLSTEELDKDDLRFISTDLTGSIEMLLKPPKEEFLFVFSTSRGESPELLDEEELEEDLLFMTTGVMTGLEGSTLEDELFD